MTLSELMLAHNLEADFQDYAQGEISAGELTRQLAAWVSNTDRAAAKPVLQALGKRAKRVKVSPLVERILLNRAVGGTTQAELLESRGGVKVKVLDVTS